MWCYRRSEYFSHSNTVFAAGACRLRHVYSAHIIAPQLATSQYTVNYFGFSDCPNPYIHIKKKLTFNPTAFIFEPWGIFTSILFAKINMSLLKLSVYYQRFRLEEHWLIVCILTGNRRNTLKKNTLSPNNSIEQRQRTASGTCISYPKSWELDVCVQLALSLHQGTELRGTYHFPSTVIVFF